MSTCITKETQTSVGEQECGICYTDLNDKNTVITPCNHAYCSTCFFKWLGRKETCALCRKVLLSDTMVEERLTDLQDVQTELMENYRCLRVLKKNIKKKKCKKNNLTDDINSLINRQIRMRCLLEQTRSVCRETLAHSRSLKQAVELQRESLDLMKNYRSEWEELHTPLSYPPEEEEEEENEEEIDVVNMTIALDNMVRLESRRARTALQRMREAARASAETIEVGSSDEDDNNIPEEAAEEEAQILSEETPILSEETPILSEETPILSEETPILSEERENDSTDSDVEGIEVDLTVFGTGIPTFDFTPLARRIVTVPTARNRSQSPMFVFSANTVSSTITSAFEIPTESQPPPIIEMTRNEPSTIPPQFDYRREENSWPLNPGHTAMRRLFARPEMEPSTPDSIQESSFEWTPINLEMSDTMTRLVARPEMEPASTEEEMTDE